MGGLGIHVGDVIEAVNRALCFEFHLAICHYVCN